MPDLAIIADDLTGALDAAAPFAARGLETQVALAPEALREALASASPIVAVSTDSREIAPAAATAAVRAAIGALPPGTPIFKKVDSRLKGNLAAELDAVPYRAALVAPAIPLFERRTRRGRIEGFGVPVPIDIRERLGVHAARARIPNVADASDFAAALDEEFDLPVGARGLADAMAERMAPGSERYRFDWTSRRAFCVIGSTDPITLAQVERLRAGRPDLSYVAAPNGIGAAAPPAALTLIQAISGDEPADPAAVSQALADTLLRLAPPPGSLLVLSGGASAQAVLRRLGVTIVRLLGEALPGLPVSLGGGLTIVTKSGGFGSPDTLSRLLAIPVPSERRRVTDVG